MMLLSDVPDADRKRYRRGLPSPFAQEERGTSFVVGAYLSHKARFIQRYRPSPCFCRDLKYYYALDSPIHFYVPKEKFSDSGSQPMCILFSLFNYPMRLFSFFRNKAIIQRSLPLPFVKISISLL